jgi:hypothetical protein
LNSFLPPIVLFALFNDKTLTKKLDIFRLFKRDFDQDLDFPSTTRYANHKGFRNITLKGYDPALKDARVGRSVGDG